MGNKGICIEIDEKLKKKFHVKCLLNNVTQKEIITQWIEAWVYGKKLVSNVKITPYIKKSTKGVKITKRR